MSLFAGSLFSLPGGFCVDENTDPSLHQAVVAPHIHKNLVPGSTIDAVRGGRTRLGESPFAFARLADVLVVFTGLK
jgi:hypothetical protein